MIDRLALQRRGTALLVTLGMLFALSILAISFARLMSVERSAARTRTTQVQAEMAAEAGFEEAVPILEKAATARPWSDPVELWVFRNQTDSDVGTGTPIERAVHPSLEDGTFLPGHPLAGLGYSRILPSPVDLEISYALKIESNAAKIYLNGGELGGPAGAGYNAVLAAFLDDLVAALKADAAFPSANLPDDAGQRILAARPADGYKSVRELVGVLGPAGCEEIADFVCVHTWVDPSTVRPDPLPLAATWGQAPLRTSPFELPPQPRAPIDVNLAPRPVLVASLTNLAARVLERRSTPRTGYEPNGYAWRVVETTPIDLALAGQVADSILLRRETAGAFRTWDEFDQWLIALGPSLPALTPLLVDVIRAAVNPNTRLEDFNPDRVLRREVDKADLSGYRTEWCLGPTGYFRIESLGRVVQEGQVVGQARLSVEYRLFQVERHTTQADFVAAQTYADDDVELLPESIADSGRPATEDGQIALAKAPNDGGDAALSFRLPLRSDLQADIGNPKAPTAASTVDEYTPATVVGPGQTDLSDLLPDGVHLDMTNDEFYVFEATNHRNWIEGGLEFWFKPNHHWSLIKEYKEPGSIGLMTILQPLADRKTTLVYQLKIVHFPDRDRPEIFSRLRIYTTKRAAAPEIGGFSAIPVGYDYKTELTYRYTTWFPKPDTPQSMSNNGITLDHGLEWQAGDWHHVAIRWIDPTQHVMWIDGCAMKPMLWGKGVFSPTSSYLWNGTKMISELQIGCRKIEQYAIGGAIDRQEVQACGTVRRVRIYHDPATVGAVFPMSGGQPLDMAAVPEVYLPPAGLSGRFEGSISVPAGATIGTIQWTELRPRFAHEIHDTVNMAARIYSIEADPRRPDVRVRYATSAAGPWTAVAGDGEGAGIGQPTSDGRIRYEVVIDDMNFQPLNVAPVLDDVTVTWLDPAVLSWTLQ